MDDAIRNYLLRISKDILKVIEALEVDNNSQKMMHLDSARYSLNRAINDLLDPALDDA